MSRAPIGRTVLTCLAFFGAAAVARQAYGQVTLDGTANPDFRGPVPFDGTNYDIRAELGRIVKGPTCSTASSKFSLATGERATFSGPDDIRNIISRVTGGARSDIDGTIRSTSPAPTSTSSTPPASCSVRTPASTCRARSTSRPRTSCALPTAPGSAPPTRPRAPYRRCPGSLRLPRTAPRTDRGRSQHAGGAGGQGLLAGRR